MCIVYGIQLLLLYLFLLAEVHHSDGQVCPQHSCNWTTSEKFPFPLCYCDQVCHVYGDCCKDAPRVFDTDDDQNSSDATLLSFDDRYCQLSRYYDTQSGIRVVNKCNKEFCSSDPLKIKSFLPVTISTGKTFLNDDCARCNGQSEFRFWYIAFNPNEKETFKSLQNENKTNKDVVGSFLRSNPGKYNLILDLDNIAPPRFCLNFLDVDNSCPNYISPLQCRNGGLERNPECLESKTDCEPRCMNPVNPFLQRMGKTNQMTVLLRFQENDNLEGEEKSIYQLEIRNPTVQIIVSYSENSPLLDINTKRFIGALYMSLQHHSGFRFNTILHTTNYKIETRNCSSYNLCYKLSFYFRLMARIAEDRIFLQNFLKKEIMLRYVDKDSGYEIPMATLTISSYVDTELFKRFWFPSYSSMSGNFKSMSEMRNCKKLTIFATIDDEKEKADVTTRCIKRLMETSGQVISHNTKSTYIIMIVILIGM